MALDQNRIRTIIESDHSFYGTSRFRSDDRFRTGTGDFILTQVQSNMRVLDVGCGSGNTLIQGHNHFTHGLGIDNDPEHIRMAKNGLKESGATNVEFRLLDFEKNLDALKPESFDLIFSQRGPLDNDVTIRASTELLKPDGMIFSETIGNQHLHEVSRIFSPPNDSTQMTAEQIRAEMEQNGIDIRIVADIFSKRIYPDIYEWLKFQCNIWSWLGEPLPKPDDPRIQMFAKQNTSSSDEIETTHHVTWVGGVKRNHLPQATNLSQPLCI